ncbi:glycoside hydrolase family 28 protein [Pseudotamlana carrageenivorans]|uniref:Glycoside hydrolase family 28 n=1 Tax=Pseudotamlana carrageenivorans TaxID=2069432 RepID=A0A2I7SEC3_9FLAO|nr:glycoside hydrolase family 28 protein [Tamlana carrageenivorans]AUS04247.1 glycoside hydrolase family 28 [Tamlana carrageenivorans]
MKPLSTLFAFILFSSFLSAQNITQEEVNQHLQNLPFQSFNIKLPSFPNKTYTITDYGAIGDGVFKNTNIINNAIKKCSQEGGGKVIIPQGLFITGPITLASDVNLHLEHGAILMFSDNAIDYPLVYSSSGKASMPSLINGEHLKNVAITGHGIINGNGDKWRPIKKEKRTEKQWKALVKSGGELSSDGKLWFPRKGTQIAIDLKKSLKTSQMTKSDWERVRLTLRPYTLNIENTKNMLVEGLTLMNSPHITNMLRGINGLVMNDVKVLNEWWYQNADGLDISRCQNVLLYNCTVNTGDDGICMKSSGMKGDQYRLENIVIKNCKVYHAHGGFVIGSNTDGRMNNIYVKNLSCSLTDIGLRFKSDVTRGGRVTNIFIEDVFMSDLLGEAISFNLNYKDNAAIPVDIDASKYLAPDFDGIHFKNIYCYGAEKACIVGGVDAHLNVKNVTFVNVLIQAKKGFEANESQDITLDNVQVLNQIGAAFSLKNTKNFRFKNMKAFEDTAILVEGANTKNILVENSNLTLNHFEISEEVNKTSITIK